VGGRRRPHNRHTTAVWSHREKRDRRFAKPKMMVTVVVVDVNKKESEGIILEA